VYSCVKPEDFYRFETIESPTLSPDGRRAVYVRAGCDTENRNKQSHLRLVSNEEDRRLTAGPEDSAPVFCPGGARVAFLSARTDRTQIHLINVDGGEAEVLETEEQPIPPLIWSPKRDMIAFRARVDLKSDDPRYPGEPAAVRPGQKDGDKKEGDEPRVITEMLYRNDTEGFTHDRKPQLFLVDPETGDAEQLTDSTCEHQQFAWRPDGRQLIYTVRKYDDRRVVYTTSVWEIDVETKTREKIMDWDGTINQISYCPTGEHLVFAATENRDPMGTAITHLWSLQVHGSSLPVENRHAHNLTPQMDRSVMGHFRWCAHNSAIYFPVGDRGTIRLYRIDWNGGTADRVVAVKTERTGVVSEIDTAETGIVLYRAENFSNPPQLFLQEGEEGVQLTQVNRDLFNEDNAATARPIKYRGPDDWEVHGWIIEPTDSTPGGRHPAVLSIHGGPNGAYLDKFDFGFQLLASNGFAVILINPRGSITYGRRFAQGVIRDWGGKDHGDIIAGLDWAVKEGIVDPNRLGVMGWSYGGYMTLWTITQTDRFAAAVAGANISNIYSLWGTSDIAPVYNQSLNGGPAFDDEEQYMGRSPIRHVRKAHTPTLLLHGESDVRTPIGQSEQFFVAMRRLGREAVFVRYPNQHHGLSEPKFVVDRWHRTLGWFNYYLRGIHGKENG